MNTQLSFSAKDCKQIEELVKKERKTCVILGCVVVLLVFLSPLLPPKIPDLNPARRAARMQVPYLEALPYYAAAWLALFYFSFYRYYARLKKDISSRMKVKLTDKVVKKKESGRADNKSFYLLTDSENRRFKRIAVTKELYEAVQAGDRLEIEVAFHSKTLLQNDFAPSAANSSLLQ